MTNYQKKVLKSTKYYYKVLKRGARAPKKDIMYIPT